MNFLFKDTRGHNELLNTLSTFAVETKILKDDIRFKLTGATCAEKNV